MNAAVTRVLIIDDDDFDRMKVRRVLKQSGINALVEECADGEQGLLRIEREQFDVVFCDYHLPGDNGLTILNFVRAAGIDTPIIMLTGIGDERLAVEMIKAGANDYLHKDKLNAETLLHALTQALRLHRAEQERVEAERRLEEANKQLLQSEKMAALGQLAAGIAHEINNPVGYVNSNLDTLRDYVDKLLQIIDSYVHAEPFLAGHDTVLAPIKTLRQQLDLDYLREDLIDLMRESKEGMDRVRRIVADLKSFSHVDDQDWQLADLNSGLDSALNIVHNELKYKANVVKEYGAIPHIECRLSQLSQVFLNLLVNAAHAIGAHGTIWIRTGSDDDHVWVEIEDTGQGIAPENLPRIFEPFFTTKPVGEGTGLGLSISYNIVANHRGRITVSSPPGKGACFRVWLPHFSPAASSP